MNKNFMKFAFASALAFAGTLSVNAQITAPEWAVDQNATIQHVGENMSVGDRFFSADEVLLFEITSTTSTSDYTYVVKVVGINTNKVADLTELTIPFSDFDNNITSKIATVDPIAVYDPSAMNTAVSSDLTGIKTLTVGYSEADDHLATTGFGITSIADGAFANLTALTEVYSYCTTPPTMTAAAFPSALYSTAKLSVAVSDLGTIAGKFANAAGWSNFMRLYTVGDTYAFGNVNCRQGIRSNDANDLLKCVTGSFTGTLNIHSQDINGKQGLRANDANELLKMITAGKRAE